MTPLHAKDHQYFCSLAPLCLFSFWFFSSLLFSVFLQSCMFYLLHLPLILPIPLAYFFLPIPILCSTQSVSLSFPKLSPSAFSPSFPVVLAFPLQRGNWKRKEEVISTHDLLFPVLHNRIHHLQPGWTFSSLPSSGHVLSQAVSLPVSLTSCMFILSSTSKFTCAVCLLVGL